MPAPISSARLCLNRASDTTKCLDSSATSATAFIRGKRWRSLACAGAFNNNAIGGGAGANARWTIAKKFDVGIHFLGGSGSGTLRFVAASRRGRKPRRTADAGYELSDAGNAGIPRERSWTCTSTMAPSMTPGQRSSTRGKGVGYGSPLFNNSGCDTETVPAGTSTTVVTPAEDRLGELPAPAVFRCQARLEPRSAAGITRAD